MSKGARTRASILQSAVEMACLQGLGGLNLQPLADRVGMTKSGLYAHFGSKEALQLATLESASERFLETVVAPSKTAPPGLPRLDDLYERWLAWPANAGLPGQCPFFAAADEFDDSEGPVRDRLERTFREFRQVCEQLIASAVRHGHLPAGTDPVQWFYEMMALRQAHHWAAGFMRDPRAMERSRTGFDRLVGRGRSAALQSLRS
jgi:AcrR family transcriptional regulator